MKRLLCLAVGCALAVLACDEGTPVAPADAILAIFANPAEISLSGESELTIIAQRNNGQPVNPGTQVFLTTTLGSLPAVVETDPRGIAQATLEAGGIGGDALVRATSGAATAETTVTISDRELEALSLTASPTSLGIGGGTVTLRALAQDEDGNPLAGVAVTFSTELGRLASGGSVVRTNASGIATDRLTVSASEAEAAAGTTFQAGANAIRDGASLSATADIRIESASGT